MNRFYKVFAQCQDVKEIKRLYRGLALQNHPDRGGDEETMKLINIAYFEALKYYDGTKQGKNEATGEDIFYNYNENLEKEVLEKFKIFAGKDDLTVEILGSWIWITGDTRSHKEQLKEHGFKFSSLKSSWFWHVGKYRKRNGEASDLDGIRERYGVAADNRNAQKTKYYPNFAR